VEEMSELLFYLMTTGAVALKPLKADWDTMLAKVTRISAMKAKTAPSISNKTIFKHMDILMEINKGK
jgi:hypothetical protein